MRPSAGTSALGPRPKANRARTRTATRPRDEEPQPAPYDWAIFGWYALLLVHAVRRHLVLLFVLWLGVVAASMGLMALLPKTYEVETTLQVLRPNGLSGGSSETDSQTKQAALSVITRDNLVALIRQTDFIENWPLHRAPLLKVKDVLWARLFRKPTEEEKLDGFVGLLEKQLWVTPGDGTVTIGVHLSDSALALRLVETALQNFLTARHNAEISSIGEVISILEQRTALAHETLDQSLQKLQDLRILRARRLGRSVQSTSVPAIASLPDPETEQLLVQLKSKRLAIADLEDFHRRRVAELEARLQEAKSKYSSTHPAVGDAELALEGGRPESAQVAALRREVVPLEAELKQRGFNTAAALKNGHNREMSLQQTLEAEDPREDEDPDIDFAKSQVRHALGHYNDMLDRTAAARLEQDRAGAAFKYRYVVLWPAQKPIGPYKPKPVQVLIGSLVAGLFLAVLGVTLVDVASKKLVEPWQVEHSLALLTLGTVQTAELAHARDGPATPEAEAPPLVPSPEVTELWHLLMVKPWTTLAVVSPDDGAHAWKLAQLLVAAAGEHQRPVLKAVNLTDLSLSRAGTVAQALAAGNFTVAGDRMRFVVATLGPVKHPVALSILSVCDATLLLLELERTLLPEAESTVSLAGRERVLGCVLAQG
jgi:uncharacterized protein involved in exopolysaccharide biosynthesis